MLLVNEAAEQTNLEVVRQIFTGFAAKVKSMPPLRLLFVSIMILLVTAGNAMQIIGLNFWLRKFPAKYGGHAGAFTTLAVSGLLFGAFFVVLLIAYVVTRRPCMEFVKSGRGALLLLGIGLMDAVNSGMAIYAANYTSEVLQALFTSLMPVYTCVFSKYVLRDQRKYFNPWIGVAFALMIVGVVVAALQDFTSEGTEESGKKKWWSLIFFLSVPPTSLMNVWQTKYMLDFTKRRHEEDRVHVSGVGTPTTQEKHLLNVASGEQCAIKEHHHHPRGEDTIVKLVMLVGDTMSQFGFIMLMLPADAVPFWGGAHSVPDAWSNFSEGISCLLHCSENFVFCCVYSLGFVFTYVGSAYLNHYSATLCSMIGQLSSPVTALLLIIVPSWNVSQGVTPWYLSVIAIVLLSVGTLLYSMWEELTSAMAPDAVLADDE